MYRYYLNLALRSLRRSRGLTALMILAIGFGVGACMTTYSVFRAVSGDPIPWKSATLFIPQVDAWGPGNHADEEPRESLTYTDAVALMRAHRGRLQSALYVIVPSVVSPEPGQHPVSAPGHAVYSEFFPMVEAPFLFGSAWTADDDRRQAAVAVISRKLNEKLFHGADSVGRTLTIEGKDYRVVGVLDRWNPQPRFYDVVNDGDVYGGKEDIFLPFERAITSGIVNDGRTNCHEVQPTPGFKGLQQSSCLWNTFMVQLDDAAAVADYRRFLDGYAREQQQAGRFTWAPNTRLRDIPAWLAARHVVPEDTRVSLVVAIGLLVVCLVNTVGLLLAKFLRRSGEIGVRRALGASRRAIYAQFLTEAGIVGLAGGALGLVLTGLGVACVGWVLPKNIAALARLDVPLLMLTLLVAVAAALLAGLYPTYRAAQVQPAWQLKSN